MIFTVTPNPGLDRTLTVPRILFNEMIRATTRRVDLGGKGLNVSRALHALGVENVAMGFVGGPTGHSLARGLSETGVATDFVHIADETRTNTVIITENGDQYVKVNEAGPAVRAEEVAAFFDRVCERVRPGDTWVLSGSLPPGVSPGFYAQIIHLIQAGAATVLLDSSGDPLRLGCQAGPHLIKPNAIEAEELTGQGIGCAADALSAAQWFLNQGVRLVALSLGADGLLLASAGKALLAKPPDVSVRNPIGAGDATLAGIAWALQCGLSLEDIARWGVAAGTAAAVRVGVSVGTRAEVEALYQRIQIEPAQRRT